jgi:Zn-dependent M28 family amino/carboxypeptidase
MAKGRSDGGHGRTGLRRGFEFIGLIQKASFQETGVPLDAEGGARVNGGLRSRSASSCAGIAIGLIGLALTAAAIHGATADAAAGRNEEAPQVSTAEPAAIKLRDTALRGNSIAWDFVSELTTRIGPRPAGSANEHAAAAWAAKKLKEYGFENVRVEEFPIIAWNRGTESGEIIAPSRQPLVVNALGYSPPTPAQGLEGEVVIFQTLDELTAAQTGSLAGKIAMVNQRMVRAQDGAGYGPVVRARAMGPVEAAKRGAIGFVLRSVSTNTARLPHTGGTLYSGSKVPIPAFAIAVPDADQIERLSAMGEKVRLHLFSSASYTAEAHSQNIMGDIRGGEKPDEVIVLGAHMDSWDLGTGAVDDAAGTAIITAAAKLIGDLPGKPRRTIRVVMFGSEEIPQPEGIKKGGPSYVAAHQGELAKHIITGESDFGAGRIYAVALPEKTFESPYGLSLMRVLTPIGVLRSKASSRDAGTDVEPMVEAGVPSFLLLQDGTHYFDLHHSADDTLDKIDRAELDQNVAAWVSVAYLAAQSDVDFRALNAEAGKQ